MVMTTLISSLKKIYPDSSSRTLKIWLKNRRVTVDGTVQTKATLPVEENQKVELQKAIFESKDFPILYEDEHLIIINKPIGLLSVPLDDKQCRNVLSILRERYPTIYAVHRIDRTTSGALLFVKTEEAREEIDKLFKNHDLTREYIALVEGHLKPASGTLHYRLFQKSIFEVCSDPHGKPTTTHYEVIRDQPKTTLVKLTLETGHKHQIRIHLKEAGHPILGDKRYGSTQDPHKRICLHAHRLSFIHPFTDKTIDVTAKAPSFAQN